MKNYQIAGVLWAMAVFVGCDDDGNSNPPDGGADAGGGNAAQLGGTDAGGLADSGGGQGGNGGSVGVLGGNGGGSGGIGGLGGNGGGLGGASGGGSGSDIATFSSGIAGTRNIAELTPAEKNRLCSAGETWRRNLFQGSFGPSFCKAAGFEAAAKVVGESANETALRLACGVGVNACLADGARPREGCLIAPSNCNITVAQLETCRNDQASALKAVTDKFPGCGMLKLADFETFDEELNYIEPAACLSLESKCPGLSEGNDD